MRRHLINRLVPSVLIPAAAAVTILAAARPADATDRFWVDHPLGGNLFGNPLNWSPAGVPGFFDNAIFDGPGGTVVVNTAESIEGFRVTNGMNVTLAVAASGSLSLNGGFFHAGDWYGLDVRGDGDLELAGDVSTDGLLLGLEVAGPNPGLLRIGSGATLTVDYPHALIGGGGWLHVAGGTLACESMVLHPGAYFPFTAGLVTVDGGIFDCQTTLRIEGIGLTDVPSLVLTNGTTGHTPHTVRLGEPNGRSGEIILRNSAQLTGDGGFSVGTNGKGIVAIDSGASATFANSVLINGPSSDPSTAFIYDATSSADADRSRLIAGGGLVVGTDDAALLLIQLGGLVEAAGDVHVASQVGGEGLLSVAGEQNGAPAELRAHDDLMVGVDASGVDRGDGSVELYDGGLIDVAAVTLIGPDDTMTMQGGTFRTASLRVLNPSVFAFPFTNGLIDVDGGLVSFASGVLSADGVPPFEDPLFRMQNGASASVTSVAAGTAGEGRFELTSGSTITAANGNVGLTAGAEGRFTFTGDGTFASITTLGIGAGGTGFVTVADRADVFSGSVALGSAGGNAILTVSGGGHVTSSGDVRIAADTTGGDAGITVTGTSLPFQSRLDTNANLLIGANATGADRGFGVLNVSNGATATVAGKTVIGPNDQLNVGGGFFTTTDLTSHNLAASNGISFGDGTIVVDEGTLDLASGVLSIDAPLFTSGGTPNPTWALANGADTTLDDLNVGMTVGPGTMFVGTDSSLYATNAAIGHGDLEVTGANAYAGFDALDVAEFGTGSVLVSATAELSPNALTIGKQTGNGTVTVGGFSTLYVDGDADVGGFQGTGTGTLHVLIGASATVVDRLTIYPNGRLELDDSTSIGTTELVPDGLIQLTLTEAYPPASGPLIESFGAAASVALAGTFTVLLDAGVEPGPGARWTVLAAPDITGAFDAVVLPTLANAQLALVETTGGLGEILELRVEADVPGDVDLDGMVGFGDLSTVLNNWGPCPVSGACAGDFDGDGAIGFPDLVILLANWG